MKNKELNRMIEEAHNSLRGVALTTPLELNERLSRKYKAKVYLKREDLQAVRSYKLRGAYNKISSLDQKEKKKGVVCASAGNHAQGVALSCERLKVKGVIYMPKNTPKQKIDRVRVLGGKWVTMVLVGDTYDESCLVAKEYCQRNNKVFIHPFDDILVIAGQGTVGLEIASQLSVPPDYVFVPVGGGGLVSGLGSYLKSKYPKMRLVGVEPEGAASMTGSIKAGKVVTLEKIDKFVDGASVRTVGETTFKISKGLIDKMIAVPEGKVCEEMISLYQSDGIITEPAGALSVSALDMIGKEIEGKTVVCVVSGGNNDISRYSEIMDRSLMYKGLKHYFIIEFSQRPGALRDYLDNALGANDDITFFEYIKKSNKETGPALVGIELSKKEDFGPLLARMKKLSMTYELLDKTSPLFRFLVGC